MTSETEVVHVAWGPSRADSIRDALRSQGCTARVIALPGALNVGPLDPADPEARRAWMRANLPGDDPCEEWCEPDAPWAEATSTDIHPVYRVCLTDAGEHATFLAFVSRMASRPFDIVDATELDPATIGAVSPIWSLGLLRPQDIVAAGLSRRRRPFCRVERDAAVATWSRLQQENALPRIVRDDHLVSAPLTHFDAALTGQARPERERAARLIGRTLYHLAFEVDPPGQGVADAVLFGRILALGEGGALEVSGPGPGMRDCEVRLPADPRGGRS